MVKLFCRASYRLLCRSKVNRLAVRTFSLLAAITILGGAAQVPNGDFTNGTNGWGVQVRDGAEASLSVENKPRRSLVIDIQKVGKQPWHVQLLNYGDPNLEVGKTYRLSFDGKADRDTMIAVFYQEDGGSWSRITNSGSTTIGTQWSRRNIMLTVNKQVAKSRLVIGNLGRSVQQIRLANFKIEIDGRKTENTKTATSHTMANLDDSQAAAAEAKRLQKRQRVMIDRPVTFTVSPERAQEFKGWGFYPSYFFRDWSRKSGGASDMFDKPKIVEAIYALQPDLIRVEPLHYMFNGPIDASKPLTPDNIKLKPERFQDLVDQIKLAQEHGVEGWIITSWSPPVSMKTLGSEYSDLPGVAEGFSDPEWEAKKKTGQVKGNYDGPWKSYLRVDSEQDMVNFWIRILQGLEEAGCGKPVAVSLQNEPNIYKVKYPACYYPPDQWRRVNKMLRAAMDEHGFEDVMIAGPDLGGVHSLFTSDNKRGWRLAPGYFGGEGWPALEADPELLRSIDAVAMHSYTVGYQNQIRQAMAKFPELEFWQTEWKPIWYSPENELIPNQDWLVISATHLARDFTKYPVHRWLLWNAYDAKDRDNTSALVKGMDEPILTDEYHLYKTIFDDVDPGWFVKYVDVDHPALQPDYDKHGNAVIVTGLGFESPDGASKVVMLVNTTESPVEANLAGVSGSGERYTLQSGMTDGPKRSSFVSGEMMELPALSATVIKILN